MKKQILACTLALLSAFAPGLQASQMATDYLSKVKFLNGTLPHIGMPDMPKHYAAFRAGCINASWIAKNPAVQKFVQDNFNTIAQTAGGIFATMVSLFAIRTLYRWNNDRTFDAKYNTDPVFRERALQRAFSDALLQLKDKGQCVKTVLPLKHPDRSGKLGILTLRGEDTPYKDTYEADTQLNMYVSDDIVQSKIWFALRYYIGLARGDAPHQVWPIVSPFDILREQDDMRVQLGQAMANYAASHPESIEYAKTPVYANRYEVLHVPQENDVELTTDTLHAYELLLTHAGRVVWPLVEGREVPIEKLVSILSANRTFAVKECGKLLGLVGTELLFYKNDFKEWEARVKFATINDKGRWQREAFVSNVTKEEDSKDWPKIRDAVWSPAPTQSFFLRNSEGKYLPASYDSDVSIIPTCSSSDLPITGSSSRVDSDESHIFTKPSEQLQPMQPGSMKGWPCDSRVKYYAAIKGIKHKPSRTN